MASDKISIKNGRLVDPKSGVDGQLDLHLADGRVAALGAAPDGFAAARVIDAGGRVVCPGLIDLAARLPGLEGELAAAVAGGVTSLACPPDTRPPLDEPGLVERIVRRAHDAGLARVLPLGALTARLRGEALAELGSLARAGCVAFSQGNATPADTQVLLRALQYAATFGYPVWLRPQDKYLAGEGVAHDGEVAARLGLPGIPAAAEAVAVATALELARATGVRLHLARLSTAAGVELVRRARADGLAVTCDVGVHHLHLTEMDIGFFDSAARFEPPLRAQRDREALSAAAADGLAAICSDHTPVDADGKQLPFGEAEAGASGLELLLPLTLKWAAAAGVPLAQALARVTCDPAAILGCAGGELSVGAPADVCVFDAEAEWQVSAAGLRSEGKNTPFLGCGMQGRVAMTLVGGRVVFAG
ncbi:dihydroorotase [Azospira restricta]|uniref:Dihydroorotase n=1 Tax=Azospira restricta TaxID=404405 RepID=A0A974SPU3_9RHOO|nr:dihydroorotase [Azospira restricta]QRJ64232.1 dihydroorotase [Azospira restricta]